MSSKQTLKRTSKFMSFVLRHKPEEIGITLDDQGWVSVDRLIEAMREHGKKVDRALIEEVVASNDKQRFTFSEDGQQIRANQGHSVDVDLDLEPQVPPDVLFHGTADRFVAQIMDQGLQKMQRQHVHLSALTETAYNVGSRHGKAIILNIDAKSMHADGHVFYVSKNGVWLTDHVPVTYINQ